MPSPPLTHRTMPCTASRPTKHNQPPSRPDTTVSTHHAERRTSPLATGHRAGSVPLRCQNVTTSCRQQRNQHKGKPVASDPQILPRNNETTTQPGDQTRPQQHHVTSSERDKRDTPRHEVTSTTSKRRTTVGREAHPERSEESEPHADTTQQTKQLPPPPNTTKPNNHTTHTPKHTGKPTAECVMKSRRRFLIGKTVS